MKIYQGDIYWLALPGVSEVAHPYVVVQADVLNHSRLPTTVVCVLTTNMKRASWPGNVLLAAGEGGLLKASVVEVAKVTAVEKGLLGAVVGRLSQARVAQILAGMGFVQRGFDGG